MNSIKTIRTKNGVTLDILSQKTKLSIGYLSHLENGTRNNPSKEVMEKIAEALNSTVPDVFFSKDN